MSSYRASEFIQAKEGEADIGHLYRCSQTTAWVNAASEKVTGMLSSALVRVYYVHNLRGWRNWQTRQV